MARTRRGARTGEEILGAAREHLLEQGLEAFSLREVARRAHLSPSAVYNHFPSKDALVGQLGMEAVQLLGTYFEPVSAGLPPGERLLRLCEAYLRFAEEQPERYRLVFDMLTVPNSTWKDYAEVAYPFNTIVSAVRDGLDSGEFEDEGHVGASAIAYGLWSLAHGFVMLSAHHLAGIRDDLEPFRVAALRAYIHGLEPR